MDYLEMLEESYEEYKQWEHENFHTKLNFLADAIFGITTYENSIARSMAQEFLQVCEAISNNTTFDFISSGEGCNIYLRTINYPFFMDRIEWGSSIRGAWWGNTTTKIKSCHLFKEGDQLMDETFNIKDLTYTMLKFVEEDT